MLKKAVFLCLVFVCTFSFAKNKAFFKYTLKKQDTLLELCDIFKVSQKDLLSLNSESKLERFWAGETIKIPLKKIKIISYTIKKGDSLFEIIKKYKTDIEAVYKLNDEQQLKRMWVGDKILIPVPKGVVSKIQKQCPLQSNKAGKITYTIQNGDTFYGLSKKFKISQRELKKQYPYPLLYAGTTITLEIQHKNPILREKNFTLVSPMHKIRGVNPGLAVPSLSYQASLSLGVKSPIEGKVIGIRFLKNYGKTIFLRQKGKTVLLSSKGFENTLVSYGDAIKQGQTIATIRKGYYLHLFLLDQEQFLNPMKYLR